MQVTENTEWLKELTERLLQVGIPSVNHTPSRWMRARTSRKFISLCPRVPSQ
jgi:hypothetical protein